MKNQVGRNDPCPCGSGKKYKKCCAKHSMGRHTAQVISSSNTQSLLGRISAAGASMKQAKETQIEKEQNVGEKNINITAINKRPVENSPSIEETTSDVSKEKD